MSPSRSPGPTRENSNPSSGRNPNIANPNTANPNTVNFEGGNNSALDSLGGNRDKPCHHCGGSGMLRLDDQRYRTCLECLGQGVLLRPSPNTLYVPRISVAASVSAAG